MTKALVAFLEQAAARGVEGASVEFSLDARNGNVVVNFRAQSGDRVYREDRALPLEYLKASVSPDGVMSSVFERVLRSMPVDLPKNGGGA